MVPTYSGLCVKVIKECQHYASTTSEPEPGKTTIARRKDFVVGDKARQKKKSLVFFNRSLPLNDFTSLQWQQ